MSANPTISAHVLSGVTVSTGIGAERAAIFGPREATKPFELLNDGILHFVAGSQASGTGVAVNFGGVAGSSFQNNGTVQSDFNNSLLIGFEAGGAHFSNSEASVLSGAQAAVYCAHGCQLVNRGQISGAGFLTPSPPGQPLAFGTVRLVLFGLG